jgi:hypothetical protein
VCGSSSQCSLPCVLQERALASAGRIVAIVSAAARRTSGAASFTPHSIMSPEALVVHSSPACHWLAVSVPPAVGIKAGDHLESDCFSLVWRLASALRKDRLVAFVKQRTTNNSHRSELSDVVSVKSYKWWQTERSRNLSNRNILVSIRTA